LKVNDQNSRNRGSADPDPLQIIMDPEHWKKQPELVLKEENVFETKEDPDLTEGTVAKEKSVLVLKEDNVLDTKVQTMFLRRRKLLTFLKALYQKNNLSLF
jgi:hypothetical protein